MMCHLVWKSAFESGNDVGVGDNVDVPVRYGSHLKSWIEMAMVSSALRIW
jgi:hypothetical protein